MDKVDNLPNILNLAFVEDLYFDYLRDPFGAVRLGPLFPTILPGRYFQ
jgi:hypothetical protein